MKSIYEFHIWIILEKTLRSLLIIIVKLVNVHEDEPVLMRTELGNAYFKKVHKLSSEVKFNVSLLISLWITS